MIQSQPKGSFKTEKHLKTSTKTQPTFTALLGGLDTYYPILWFVPFADGIQVLSAFAGVSQQQVVAILERNPSFAATTAEWEATHPVSTVMLHIWLQQLLHPDRAMAETWWEASDVTVYDLSIQDDEDAADVLDEDLNQDDGNTHGQDDNARLFQSARSHRPSRCISSSQQTTEESGDRGTSAHSTRNSGNWRDVNSGRLSAVTVNSTETTTATAVATRARPLHGAVPSMESVVAVALAKFDVAAVAEAQQEQKHKNKKTVADVKAACSCGRPGSHRDRSLSPPPARLAAVGIVTKSIAGAPSPLPPSTTLAELEKFVHRGKTLKVCRQFVRTGVCSYGARCLFHHPRPAALVTADRHIGGGGSKVPAHRWNADPEPYPRENPCCIPCQTAVRAPVAPFNPFSLTLRSSLSAQFY